MLKFNSHSIQGRRAYQEDRIAIIQDNGDIVAAIIDGHGGDNTAEFIKKYIEGIAFSSHEDDVNKSLEEIYDDMHYYASDKDENNFQDGACLLVSNVGEKGDFEISWVGDCVAFQRGEKITTQLNKIHNLNNVQEVERITKEIGRLYRSGPYLMSSTIREYGLIPTRTIGDRDFEVDGVSHEPEIITGKLEKGESLILVTDGVTDVLSKDQLEKTAEEIVLRAYKAGSSDNISAIVITLE